MFVNHKWALWLGAFSALTVSSQLFALDPQKKFTQYTRTVWTQAQGLPQDTIRAIAQTADGYLWLGTREGLERFDGYDFLSFTRNDGALPSNGVTALATGRNGALWIGTLEGVSLYQNGRFRVFTERDGLPASPVNSMAEDSSGTLWVVAGNRLFRLDDGRATAIAGESLAPLDAVQVVYADPAKQLWIGGAGGLLKRSQNQFIAVLGPKELKGDYIDAICQRPDGLWLGGNHGAIHLNSDGTLKRFSTAQGLSHESVLALATDHGGNLWAGTGAGLSRLGTTGFVNPPRDSDVNVDRVWSIFEDREGDLWIGTNSSLIRLRDDRFLAYGTPEGMPSNEPTVVRQDRRGTIWIGYHDRGLFAIDGEKQRLYTTADGLPSDEIFNVREARNGDLLIGTRNGFSRFHDGRFSNSAISVLRGRSSIYDIVEDKYGAITVATSDGLYKLEAGFWQRLAPQKDGVNGIVAALTETPDGGLWVAMFNRGLRLLEGGTNPAIVTRKYTTADGLGSNEIRSLYQEPDGTLWIGTFGSGLNVLRNGVFHRYGSGQGMLSDNISHVEDDGRGNLWLSTTRGISEISRQQLRDFDQGRTQRLQPRNLGLQDGLRSAQCAPGFPTAGGGTRTHDGQLWFATARGLARLDPAGRDRMKPDHSVPLTKVLEISADGMLLDPLHSSKLKAGTKRVQFRYTGVYLSAPERVSYSTKLEGLDPDWVPAGSRRVIVYNPLGPGQYHFRVRSTLPEGTGSESEFAFVVAPHFYQTWWFLTASILCLAATTYGFHRFHLQQVKNTFSLVLAERTRLAREIHDTLAQNFLAIASQLDTSANKLNSDPGAALRHLRLAQRMTRHSFTEARRAVTDLRSAEITARDLPAALSSAAQRWVAGSKVSVQLEMSCPHLDAPPDLAQNVLRIAQEAVTNAMRHAEAHTIWLALESKDDFLRLRVKDDGNGFEAPRVFDLAGGHFGILGMGERAQRLGGKFRIDSQPGGGTEIEVTVPLNGES